VARTLLYAKYTDDNDECYQDRDGALFDSNGKRGTCRLHYLHCSLQ